MLILFFCKFQVLNYFSLEMLVKFHHRWLQCALYKSLRIFFFKFDNCPLWDPDAMCAV